MEGVEEIPAHALEEGTDWDWESFPDYLDALGETSPLLRPCHQGAPLSLSRLLCAGTAERKQFAVDVGVNISHGAVRAYVLGEGRANEADRPGGPFESPLTDEEIAAVAAVVREGVEAGAMGFCSNREADHRDSSGVCVPGTMASAEEMVQIAVRLD